MNTEVLIIWQVDKDGGTIWEENESDAKGMGMYVNKNVGFSGNIRDAHTFAIEHNFRGGVEVARRRNGKVYFQTA